MSAKNKIKSNNSSPFPKGRFGKGLILVTGGTGYIGSHTVVELLEKGFEVVIIDNLSNSRIEVLDSIEKITGKRPQFWNIDLCDKAAIQKKVLSLGEDLGEASIIHFAAYKAVGESVEKPLMYYRNNLLSLTNLLEICEEYKVKNFVFSFSCSVYGEPDHLPIDEKAPLKKAESPYGNTKQICEDILADVAKVSDLQTIALRYFNPVGAHESALIGEYPLQPPTNLFPVITQTVIGKRDSFNVFGDNYDTPDGSCIRDYIHVVDIAKAHVVAIERLMNKNNKSSFEIFNLGTGKGHSVLEAIKTFEKITGQKVNYKIAPRREGDVIKVYADTKLANKELGWKAEKKLEEMLSSAWKWELALKKLAVSSKQ